MSGNDLEDKVDKDICKIIHKQVDKQFGEMQACVTEIRGAVGEMKEIAASNNEILKILMEERSARINQTQQPQQQLQQPLPQAQQQQLPQPRKRFWEMGWFKYIVVAGCIIAVVIVGAAVGYNIIDHYIQAVGGAK